MTAMGVESLHSICIAFGSKDTCYEYDLTRLTDLPLFANLDPTQNSLREHHATQL